MVALGVLDITMSHCAHQHRLVGADGGHDTEFSPLTPLCVWFGGVVIQGHDVSSHGLQIFLHQPFGYYILSNLCHTQGLSKSISKIYLCIWELSLLWLPPSRLAHHFSAVSQHEKLFHSQYHSFPSGGLRETGKCPQASLITQEFYSKHLPFL